MKNFLIQESAMSIMPQISKRNENTVEFIAVLQEANRPNRNGRIYRKEVLEQALAAPYVQERLRTNSFFSECGHPMDTSVQRQMTIDQRNIACLIKEFWWEGDLLKAKVETANTAIGRDMKGLIEQGSRVAFSLRAQGNVHHDPMLNATIVEAPIQIATYDWVVNPSHDKAFLESICEATSVGFFGSKQTTSLMLSESVNLFENGSLISLTEVAQPVVKDYAKNFGLKFKPLSETYIYQEGDVLAGSGKVATIVNNNVTKKVVLEDFLLKDLRHRIARLTEEEAKLGDEAAEPVHGTKASKEHTPELDNKDVYPADEHQQAEEVKEVIVESLIDFENTDGDLLESLEEYSPESTIDTMSGKKSAGWSAFWGWFFLGPIGAVLFYLIRKSKNEKFDKRAEKLAKIAEKDKETKEILFKIRKGINEKISKSELKELKSQFKEALLNAENKEENYLSESKLEVSKPEEQQYKVEEEIAPSDAPEPVVKTEIKSGEVVVQAHDHADAEGKKVRNALVHEGTEPHQEDQMLDDKGELVDVEDTVFSEIKNGKVVVQDHDHADAEGKKVRNAIIQERFIKKDSKLNEEYTREDLQELFEALELDTDKYTFEYLAEELGFKTLQEATTEVKNIAKKFIEPISRANISSPLAKEAGISEKLQRKANMYIIGKNAARLKAKGITGDTYEENPKNQIPTNFEQEKKRGQWLKNISKQEDEEVKVNESYTREELMEAFEALELDTNKYTFEYLAEQLGFKSLVEEPIHDQTPASLGNMLPGELKNFINSDILKGHYDFDSLTDLEKQEVLAAVNTSAVSSDDNIASISNNPLGNASIYFYKRGEELDPKKSKGYIHFNDQNQYNNLKKKLKIEESYTREELMEAFEALELDTDKYTFEFLAEQLGFETIYPSEKHTQEVDVNSKELGGEPSNARVAAQKPAKAGETVESSEEIKSEKLGGEPTDARVKAQKPTKAGETLHHAEEVKAVIVESAKVKLGNIKVKGGK